MAIFKRDGIHQVVLDEHLRVRLKATHGRKPASKSFVSRRVNHI
ncbi:hypothetical protein WP8W18C01_33480 [Pseudomonas putida]|uniref:Uncharacterized protein n=1 Tax=Pseudomonas putida TaxID=303 RepID=A0A6S5TNE7_PSEPU|nr:hypothetical protein WP8W18C01_33480 [Pseudomonas putida]